MDAYLLTNFNIGSRCKGTCFVRVMITYSEAGSVRCDIDLPKKKNTGLIAGYIFTNNKCLDTYHKDSNVSWGGMD